LSADALVQRLGKLDTCAVSDAMDRLSVAGAALGIRPQWLCPRIAGHAVTVKLVKRTGNETAVRHLGTAAIMAADAGDVIVVQNRDVEGAAGWGGILSNAAKVKGVAGVIVDGPARDIDESRDVGFPVYSRSATPQTARGRIVEESFNEPITVGNGITVNPGDLVLADWSGVLFLPAARAEEIVAAAEEIAAREALMTKDVLAGKAVTEVMGINYETMLHR
jgi:4-hydroxy-4-methyl-2-oxoglutarate aldolase